MTILRILLLSGCLLSCWQVAIAHGRVSIEDDKCVINIGFLTAHFTAYQSEFHGTEEFCEDIPEVADSEFVIEYLHDFLRQMRVDFRIIKDLKNFGVFANWDDISSLQDIEQGTVFYQAAMRWPDGVLSIDYQFQQAGGYIGIVTAEHPDKEKVYRAVFYFQVGGTDYGYVPLFISLVILALLLYWITNKFRSH